jgi:hypothetical protein
MKTIIILILGIGIMMGCKSDNISPVEIEGKWNNSYQIQTKVAKGKWSEWTTINTLVALPTLEFTNDAKILWDSKQSDYCCVPRTYKIKDGNILTYTSGTFNCELALCVAYKDWVIEKITSDTLEINQFYTKVRYLRAK